MLASPARLGLGLGLVGGWAGPVSVCLGHCCQTPILLLQKSSLREQLRPELGRSGGASNLKGVRECWDLTFSLRLLSPLCRFIMPSGV